MRIFISTILICVFLVENFSIAQESFQSFSTKKNDLNTIAKNNINLQPINQNSSESNTTFWTVGKYIFTGVALVSLALAFIDKANNNYGDESDSYKTLLVIGGTSTLLAAISFAKDFSGDKNIADPKEDIKPPDPQFPPVLASKIQFFDSNKDNFLESDESGKIILTITNNGDGIAYNLSPKLIFDNSNIKSSIPQTISQLKPSEEKEIIFNLSSTDELQDGRTSFEVLVTEYNGFDLVPSAKISIPTKKAQSPELIVTDIAIKDNNNNRRIDPAEIVEVTARLQNIGQGDARDIKAELQLGENIFLTEESKKPLELGNIKSGEYKDVVFSTYTNNRATGIDISLNIIEQRPKYSSSQKLDLAFNRVEKSTDELVIQGTETTKNEILISTLSIDIEQDIPEISNLNKTAVAIIIGNQRYDSPNVPAVDFAINDASLMREYLTKTMGYDDVNIIFETDATQAKFISIFGSEGNHKGRLFNYVKEGKSDVFIYYSGHGAPDPESKQGYFVPVDCDPSLVTLNGYSLNTFYDNLSKINYKSLTIVIDACFSGSSDKGTLLKNISPVFITIENPFSSKENTTVFTSASGDQVSSWYPEKRHSLFTYYFLKGLKGDADLNADESLTIGEIKNYIMDNVPYMARRLNNREQTPQVVGDENKIFIQY